MDLHAIGLDLSAMAEDLDPGGRRLRRRSRLPRRLLDAVARPAGPRSVGRGITVAQRPYPLCGRFGSLRDLVWQPDVQSRLAPQQQLHAFQASQAEVPLEGGME